MVSTIDKAVSSFSLRINQDWSPEDASTEKSAWESFLKADLADSIVPTPSSELRPETFSLETTCVEISSPLLVQVVSVEDVGKPKYKPAAGMEEVKEDEEGVECGKYLEGTEKEAKTESGPKMLKVGFKSAYGNFFGLEMERITLFSPEMEMGMKLILRPPFIVRRGIALLWSKHCEALKTLSQLTKY
eukprot:TRINITY_DN1998_c0_g1_i1.p2 TRINITY_DN1998_c0_g1~~TRINITY_DN1998_c0_g1_i1.p2  ORF type:complete len:188 (-),score=85.13 TRINITY_DN1998_c0_g1_i1:657-1220(-)